MKAHIGVDANSGLVHTVVGTTANVNWHIVMRPGKRRALNKSSAADRLAIQTPE